MAPVHDSKEALRFRAVCDERITLPLSSLRAFDSVYTKLVSGLSKSSMVEVKVNYVVHDWVEQVPQEAAGAYNRLGYSQDLPSISAWEVVGKEKFKTIGGYMCRFCKGFWRANRGGGCSRSRGGTKTRPHACRWTSPRSSYIISGSGTGWRSTRGWSRRSLPGTSGQSKGGEQPSPWPLLPGARGTQNRAHALQLLEWPGGCLHCLVGHFEQPGEVRAGGHPLGGKGGDLEG